MIGLRRGPVPPVFLTAHWRNLVMLNYDVDPAVLTPFLPPGIELDAWQGRTLASTVGFDFADVRVFGLSVPFHRRFPEINLRFYVRRRTAYSWRRGVVFVRELVPRPAVALLAHFLFGEPYKTLPMRLRHHAVPEQRSTAVGQERAATTVRYSWRYAKIWNHVEATADTTHDPRYPDPASEEAFITDHVYGYGTRAGVPTEYIVEHPPWRYWNTLTATFACTPTAIGSLWGNVFTPYLASPRSALLVEGSPVIVRRPRTLAGLAP